MIYKYWGCAACVLTLVAGSRRRTCASLKRRVSQEEQVVPAARARQEGPEEPAEREDAGGPHGAGRQAQAAAHRGGAVPALARRAHGDAQPGQPLLHQVHLPARCSRLSGVTIKLIILINRYIYKSFISLLIIISFYCQV